VVLKIYTNILSIIILVIITEQVYYMYLSVFDIIQEAHGALNRSLEKHV